MARSCSKCRGRSAVSRITSQSQQTQTRNYVVKCIDCTGNITTKFGLSLPAHDVPVTVSQEVLDDWLSKGHKLTYQPL